MNKTSYIIINMYNHLYYLIINITILYNMIFKLIILNYMKIYSKISSLYGI